MSRSRACALVLFTAAQGCASGPADDEGTTTTLGDASSESVGTPATTATSGAAEGSGGTEAEPAGDDDAGTSSETGAPHTVGDCDGLPPAGTWEHVTPAQLDADAWCVPGSDGCDEANSTYGTNAFALDPATSGTIYLGTSSKGVWKSADCGSTWEKINTGTEAAALDAGRNWSIVVDPIEPDVVYTVTGYAGAGFYRSDDGGRNWDQMFPADLLAGFPGQGIEKIAMDPEAHRHLTATFHGPCANGPGGGEWACMAETLDGGFTWRLTNSAQYWSEGDGQTMVDATTWFFSNGGDVHRTIDAGATWTKVKDGFSVGEYDTGGCIYTGPDGVFYAGGSRGMSRSNDGISWQGIEGAPAIGGPNGGCSLTTDGTHLYASMGLLAYAPATTDWFWRARLDDLSTWEPMDNPAVITGAGWLDYDADHRVLYASNSTGGFWRLVVP